MDKEKLKKIEIDTDILDWEIHGIKIWRYERFMIYRYLTELESKGKSDSILSKEFDRINKKKYFKLFLRHKSSPISKRDILIFNHSRRILQNGTYVCKFTEKISDYYKNTLTYEVPFNESHIEPAKTSGLRYLDRIILKSYVYEIICRKVKKREYKKDYIDILDKLKSVFLKEYAEDTYKYLAKSMVKNLFLIKYRRRAIEKLIKKVSPKLIIEVVGYSRNNMVVNECAKKFKIPTIELQHSQINDQLIQYMWWNRNDIEQFPDFLFTFGEFWQDGLELPIVDDHVKAIGFPYFEEEIEQVKNKPVSQEIESDILFISQYLAGKSVYELMLDCCQINPNLKLVYKLHPEEYDIWESRYPELKNCSNVKVITDPNVSLYDCFNATKAVVGVFSGALYEALAFDLPVYLYNARYIEYMQKLIDVKGAVVINNASELLDNIAKGISTQVPDLEIWRTNSFNNLVSEIDKILNESMN